MSDGYIAVADIVRNPDALRQVDREDSDFVALVESVKVNGVTNPIVVRPAPGTPGKFMLIDGDHRFTAAEICGLKQIRAVVDNEADDAAAYRIQVVSNLHKIQTKPAAYAQMLQRMIARDPLLTIPALARDLSVAESWLHQRLRLVDLHPDIQTAVDAGEIKVTNAVALAKLPIDRQLDWLDRAMTMGTAEFAPAVDELVKELRKAKREGREAAGPKEWTPTPKLRKFAEISAASASGGIVASIIGVETDPVKAAIAALNWALSLDDDSIQAQLAQNEARKQKAQEDKDRAAAERATKAEAEAKKKADALRARVASTAVTVS